MDDDGVVLEADGNSRDRPVVDGAFAVELTAHDFQDGARHEVAGEGGQLHFRLFRGGVGVAVEGQLAGDDQDDAFDLEQGRDQAGQLQGAFRFVIDAFQRSNCVINSSHGTGEYSDKRWLTIPDTGSASGLTPYLIKRWRSFGT